MVSLPFKPERSCTGLEIAWNVPRRFLHRQRLNLQQNLLIKSFVRQSATFFIKTHFFLIKNGGFMTVMIHYPYSQHQPVMSQTVPIGFLYGRYIYHSPSCRLRIHFYKRYKPFTKYRFSAIFSFAVNAAGRRWMHVPSNQLLWKSLERCIFNQMYVTY